MVGSPGIGMGVSSWILGKLYHTVPLASKNILRTSDEKAKTSQRIWGFVRDWFLGGRHDPTQPLTLALQAEILRLQSCQHKMPVLGYIHQNQGDDTMLRSATNILDLSELPSPQRGLRDEK